VLTDVRRGWGIGLLYVNERHMEDGLLSEDPGPTEKGEESNVALVLNLGGCTPACDGSKHLCDVGAVVFLFEDTGVGERKSTPGTDSMARQTYSASWKADM
jgi:hypothetical protein